MNIFKILKTAVIILTVTSFLSCECRQVHGIDVSEILLVTSEDMDINYCKLLRNAIEGNSTSIEKLTLLEFYSSPGYDHGSVIVNLIDIIGEDKFIEAFTSLTKRKRSLIEGYIDVGLEYGDNINFRNKSLKEAFPKIYTFLK